MTPEQEARIRAVSALPHGNRCALDKADLRALLSERTALLERVERAEVRNAEVNMLASSWMARHDWLLSFVQNQPEALKALCEAESMPYPSPADLPKAVAAANARAQAAETKLATLTEALGRIAEDRCGPKPVGFTPSAETRLSLAKAEARAALSQTQEEKTNG